MITNNRNINSINYWTDFWYYQIGVNIIPADTKNKKTYENWSQLQDKSIPEELHEKRKKNGEYNKGIAIVTGPIWRGKNKGKYLNGIDCDNKKAIEEIFTNGSYANNNIKIQRVLENLQQKMMITQNLIIIIVIITVTLAVVAATIMKCQQD